MNQTQVYLLDTSVVLRLLRRRPDSRLVSRATPLVASNSVAINDVVRMEALVGCNSESEARRVREAIDGFVPIRVTETTWNSATRLGFVLRRKGVTAAVPDLLIASSAIEIGATLMHVDSDFDKIAAHSDLRVESYVESPN